ncbi:retrovirus-related pol polyprotein from transposon TNT 1-94 [Tanacetum coccineum]|uniref:Retrovirus-related pol polyprotein from transposon TNT 1-94 n=1 Tax=Tanacetum coccineum TaxID=301880 RepID=A0ABQ5FEI4_9ASTR
MLNNQKSSSCKIGLGFDSSKASTSGTKPISFVGSSAENATDGSTIKVHGSTIPGSVSRTVAENVTEHVFSPPMSSRSDFVITRKKLIHNRIDESKKPSLKPSLKSGLGYVKTESRYTWTRFLKTKNEAFEKFEILSRKIQNQLGSSIVAIRTDHGREFDNEVQFGAYCDAQGITHNFSAPRTPQSNGVVERKNRTLQEMSRTMLNEQSIPQKFWCNVVDTSTYILNRILIRPILGKTPYEIFRGRKPSLEYFKVFGSKCFILNTKDYLTKFDPKSYEGVFLGYSQNSKAYIVLNKHTMKVEESLNVTFDESPPPTKLSPLVDDDVGEEEAIINNTKVVNNNNEEDESIEVDEVVNIKESKNHPLDQVIGNLNQRTLRSQAQDHSNFFCFISTIEPKNVNEALKDESWVVAMQEELNQFVANDVWDLVPLPMSQSVIGTKWVFRNKLDENGIVSRNKARLVAQGYNQQEGIDYDETYAPVARLESIRILLAIACANDFKLYQINVKSAFLNGFINEEVYVAQWKRISHKRTKNKAKDDKTDHGMEKCVKTKPNRSQKKLDINKKDRKTKTQNDKTEHGMEKTVARIKAKVNKCQSQSHYRRISKSIQGVGNEDILLDAILTHLMGRESPIVYL